MSLHVLGYSFAISAGILSIKEKTDISLLVLLLLIQMLWIMSFFYISNRRFAIHTIATYIKERLENKETGPYWETWLRQKDLPKSFSIYYVESIICTIPVIGVFLYLGYEFFILAHRDIPHAVAFALAAIFISVYIKYSRTTIKDYNKLRRVSSQTLI